MPAPPHCEITQNSHRERLEFITKTLKAFLNLYHYSVGELSVAVVAPVKHLIEDLNKMMMVLELSLDLLLCIT